MDPQCVRRRARPVRGIRSPRAGRLRPGRMEVGGSRSAAVMGARSVTQCRIGLLGRYEHTFVRRHGTRRAHAAVIGMPPRATFRNDVSASSMQVVAERTVGCAVRLFCAAYDLSGSTHNYASFFAKLRALGARQALPSLWLVETPLESPEISSQLLGLLGPKDKLFVVEINAGSAWAATRLDDQAGPWLKARRP